MRPCGSPRWASRERPHRGEGVMSELRATLLILGAVFIAALAWWERRRPRHASGAPEAERRASPADPAAELTAHSAHDPLLSLPLIRAREPSPPAELPVLEVELEPPTLAAPEPEGVAAATDVPAAADAPAALHASSAADRAAAMMGGSGAQEPPGAAATVSLPAALPIEPLPHLPVGPEPLVNWPPDQLRRVVT